MTVGFVIPIWNGTKRKQIEDSLTSLIKLSHQISEIIIVYDGIECKKLEFKIPNEIISIVKKCLINKNSGPGLARNIGIESSKSKFIFLLDAGDICHRERINLQLPELKKYNVSYSNISYVGNSRKVTSKCLNFKNAKKIISFRNPYPNQTLAITKDLFTKVGGFPSLRFAEDWVLAAKLLKVSNFISLIEKPLVSTEDISMIMERRHGFKILKEVITAHIIMISKSLYCPLYFPFVLIFQIFLRLMPYRLFNLIYILRINLIFRRGR
tara:strand:- start:67 stop:870 length:804 start_codon:yes stop_codon:yes gene_type:complete